MDNPIRVAMLQCGIVGVNFISTLFFLSSTCKQLQNARVTLVSTWDSWASIPVRATSTLDSSENNSGLWVCTWDSWANIWCLTASTADLWAMLLMKCRVWLRCLAGMGVAAPLILSNCKMISYCGKELRNIRNSTGSSTNLCAKPYRRCCETTAWIIAVKLQRNGPARS
ncbi:hypothetical protein DBV15_07703 [Temnothorax longispinosus]|uniref:Uncharacterized protein n=1 Tax=Temnothorax longispinosus TaxID=300112 RepID=A0A4S2KVK5_9HYME|nr:hypothetical protein DBV15_07703 [Temnothorax longispinosus]